MRKYSHLSRKGVFADKQRPRQNYPATQGIPWNNNTNFSYSLFSLFNSATVASTWISGQTSNTAFWESLSKKHQHSLLSINELNTLPRHIPALHVTHSTTNTFENTYMTARDLNLVLGVTQQNVQQKSQLQQANASLSHFQDVPGKLHIKKKKKKALSLAIVKLHRTGN